MECKEDMETNRKEVSNPETTISRDPTNRTVEADKAETEEEAATTEVVAVVDTNKTTEIKDPARTSGKIREVLLRTTHPS